MRLGTDPSSPTLVLRLLVDLVSSPVLPSDGCVAIITLYHKHLASLDTYRIAAYV